MFHMETCRMPIESRSMARTNPKTFQSRVEAEILQPTDRCFYCGEHLRGESLVYWHGNDETGHEIWLHQTCAITLAGHLAKDAQ